MAIHELLWVIHYVKTVVNYHEFPSLLALSCWTELGLNARPSGWRVLDAGRSALLREVDARMVKNCFIKTNHDLT